MSDSMRKTLVTNFFCVDCGRALKISYGKENNNRKNHYDGEEIVTGAAKVDLSVFVYPCDCALKAQRDLENLKELLK